MARQPVLRLDLEDDDAEPLAGARFVLVVGHETTEGETDGTGRIEVPVPAEAQTARLTVELTRNDAATRLTWDLDIGHLDPIDTASGVQARLRNLGIDTGPIDGIVGPLTRAAVKAFQRDHDLDVDGIAGPKTQAKLETEHGC